MKTLVVNYLEINFLSGCNLAIEYMTVKFMVEYSVSIFFGDQFSYPNL